MLKKMRPKTTTAHYEQTKIGQHYPKNPIAQVLQYTIPELREYACGWQIEFHAYDPVSGRMKRKRIKVNRIHGLANRRKHARQIITRLIGLLDNGWNPWINSDIDNITLIDEAFTRYENYIEKMLESGYYRKETYSGYKSYSKMLKHYATTVNPIRYCYQLDRKYLVEFLDWVFIERNNTAQTRNNYLCFLRVFCGWLVERGFAETRATDGINPINKRLYQKSREVLPDAAIRRLSGHCAVNDPDFLSACYLLYYCFIRPVEMTRLKVENINVKSCTITIPGEISKNKNTQTVTMPAKVLHHLIARGVFNHSGQQYLFSWGFRPGIEQIDTKQFRDQWERVRKKLKFPKSYKFYSLKDSGITALCKANMAAISVRDQARHSSLAITDIYTAHNAKANPDIIKLDGAL